MDSSEHKTDQFAVTDTLRSTWTGAWAAVLGTADRRGLVSGGGVTANAGILLWKNRLRIGFACVAALLMVAAYTLNLMPTIPRALWIVGVSYLAAVLFVGRAVRRARRADPLAFLALVVADLGITFIGVALLADPQHYGRALFVCLIALQFAHAFLGIVPSLLVVGGSVLGYVALVTAAVERGAVTSWSGDLWMLVLYLAVAVNAVALHARFNRRLSTLVDLFSLAERGDFSRAYQEEADYAQDGLTVLGRAYNHLRAELAALVLADPLTACLNRRGFEQELAREVARSARDGGDLALLAVDIDHFKEINDGFGHLAGDTVLRELADLLTSSARAGDVVGRVGGDELVILLPGADLETAGVVAERISAVVRGHHFITTRGHGRVTVSVGIAAEQVHDPWLGHALRARADEALYVAKRLGRDRVVLWAPGIRSQSTPPQSTAIADIEPPVHRGNGLGAHVERIERAD